MVRLLPVFASILVASTSVSAAPVPQPIDLSKIGTALGGLIEGAATKAVGSCNVDRFKIVTNLAATGALVKKIDASDPATAASVKTVQDGLRSAGEGIAQIALALVTGGSPPAAARDQTQKGLLDAQTALSSIKAVGTEAAVAKAAAKLTESISNGNDVVADCGGSGAAAGGAAAGGAAAGGAAEAPAAGTADDTAAADDSAATADDSAATADDSAATEDDSTAEDDSAATEDDSAATEDDTAAADDEEVDA